MFPVLEIYRGTALCSLISVVGIFRLSLRLASLILKSPFFLCSCYIFCSTYRCMLLYSCPALSVCGGSAVSLFVRVHSVRLRCVLYCSPFVPCWFAVICLFIAAGGHPQRTSEATGLRANGPYCPSQPTRWDHAVPLFSGPGEYGSRAVHLCCNMASVT